MPKKEKKYATKKFLAKPLAGFLNDNGESNIDIAKNIVEYFKSHDTGNYAAIVSDTRINDHHVKHKEDKYRYEKDVEGKYIIVFKAFTSGMIQDTAEDTIKSYIRGFMLDNRKATAATISDELEDVFGGSWAVIRSTARIYHTYDEYSFILQVKNSTWKIWRQ